MKHRFIVCLALLMLLANLSDGCQRFVSGGGNSNTGGSGGQVVVNGITDTNGKPIIVAVPYDCADIQKNYGNRSNGIYKIYRPGCSSPTDPFRCAFDVVCDLQTDGGGWTVIQQRVDGGIDFFRSWGEYRDGFGDLSGNFWLSTEYIYELTSRAGAAYELLIQLETFDGAHVTSLYDKFSLAAESDLYRLKLGSLFQDGSPADSLLSARNQQFSTFDKASAHESTIACASYWNSGWWHEPLRCAFAGDLNVPYNSVRNAPHLQGVVWKGVAGDLVRLRKTVMKMRPVNFLTGKRYKQKSAAAAARRARLH